VSGTVVLDAEIERIALHAAKVCARKGTLKAAYVFGSYVTGRADEWSDIDVAAFMKEAASWDLWERTRIIVTVQKEVGYDIEIHLFPASSLISPEPGSFAADIIKNGVRIM
jgi:predicted nucleotidyltransferase